MAENNYDLEYTGSMVDRILDTGYDLQNQGYIFRGLVSHYTGTPTERTWLIAPTGSTGFGLSSPVPPGSIGICMYNGSSWSAEVLNTLTLDSAPTTGSGNGITSGAVKTLAESITNAIGQLEQSVSDRFTSLELEDTTGSLQAEVLSITLKYVFEGEEEALTSLSILAATAEKAGLMSAADKQKLDAFVTNIRSLRIQDTTAQADQGTKITNTLKWTIGGVTEAITAFTLYAATTSKAGLMSAADKQMLDGLFDKIRTLSISDTTPQGEEGVKIVESLSATLGGTAEVISTFTILAATASKAGLMSAADKNALDTLPSLINAGYLYAGIATPSTVPSSTSAKIFYIAIEGGTYTSFGDLNVTQGINIIYKSGNAWSVVQAVGMDDEPTAGSGNLVKSEGVYDAVGFKFTRHGFLSTFGGYVESEYHRCTELIPCHQATYKIQCNAKSSQISVAFYDRQKVFLSGLSGSSESVSLTTFTGDVPSDCYYMVVCNVNGYQPSAPKGNVIINRIENTDEGFVVSGDKTAFSIDGYFDAAGNLHERRSWKATDYIPVRPGVPYSAVVYMQTGVSNIVFYNSSKQVLSTVIGSEEAVTAISGTVPDSAYFARFCSYNTAATIREAAFGFYFDFKNALEYGEDDLFGLYKNNFTGKPFSFAGKKAAFFGDSVTYGVKSDPLSRADKCYREWLCERLGLTGTNCAVSGSFICDLEDAETSILNKVLDTISSQSEYDFIFIAGGINDYWTGKPLGTIEDSTYATFYGALNVMCDYLTQTIGNGTEVIFLTPINCTRSDLSQTTNPLDDYRNAIFRVATIHGFNVVDTSVIGFPSNIKDTYFRSQLIADGVHPTELGHKIMGLNIAAILQPDANAESERDYTYWGNLTPSTQYTNSSRILWIEDSGTKVKFAKSIKFKPVPDVATNVYKVSVDNGEATVLLIKTSANTGIVAGDIVELELDVRLEENEFIGLNRSLCYDNTGFGSFHYTYCPVGGGEVVSVADGSAIAIQYYGEIETEGPATKEIDNEFIVDINGNGHYTNPFEAMVGLKGKDTANHPITIKVMPGTYIMPTLPPADFFTYCTNRYLSLIGVDKVNCILRNDNGYYNASSSDPDNLGDNSPLKISGNIYIANLTIISTDNDNAEETGDVYHRSYCIHMDATASAGSIMEVHNCRLVNNHAPCIGFGIPKDVTLKITDCELESDFWNPNYIGAVIYGHDRDGSVSEVEEHVVVANCIIKSQNGDAFKSYNNHSALMDCVFVNNACALPSGKGVVLDTYTSVIPPSFGNSVEAMNVITN